jgi:hypothetical protein
MGFVRVKAPDGAEFTIDEGAVKGMGVSVLSKDAVDINGRPLAAKPATTKDGKPKSAAAEKKES